MIERQDDWAAALDAEAGFVTFTIGTHGGPRIPREADGHTDNVDSAATSMVGGLPKGDIRSLFNTAVSDHFSKPSEWRCEALRRQGKRHWTQPW